MKVIAKCSTHSTDAEVRAKESARGEVLVNEKQMKRVMAQLCGKRACGAVHEIGRDIIFTRDAAPLRVTNSYPGGNTVFVKA